MRPKRSGKELLYYRHHTIAFLFGVMACFALSVAAFLLLTVLSTYAHAAVLVSRASGTPTCFVCPSTDTNGFPVADNNDKNGVLFCSYPSFPHEDPKDFFCTYDDSDGHLIRDGDVGLCPAIADSGPCVTRKDDNFKAMKRRNEARAAQPQTSRPQARSKPLRKKKRVD